MPAGDVERQANCSRRYGVVAVGADRALSEAVGTPMRGRAYGLAARTGSQAWLAEWPASWSFKARESSGRL